MRCWIFNGCGFFRKYASPPDAPKGCFLVRFVKRSNIFSNYAEKPPGRADPFSALKKWLFRLIPAMHSAKKSGAPLSSEWLATLQRIVRNRLPAGFTTRLRSCRTFLFRKVSTTIYNFRDCSYSSSLPPPPSTSPIPLPWKRSLPFFSFNVKLNPFSFTSIHSFVVVKKPNLSDSLRPLIIPRVLCLFVPAQSQAL